MRRRSTQNAYSVSLFPFLAVLICTMGILVALLVVAVREADRSAKADVAEVRDQKQKEIQQVQDLIEDNEFRIEGLEGFRPDVVQRLQEAREKRAHLQNHLKELDDEALELARQLQQIEKRPDDVTRTFAQLEAEQALLKEQILAGQEHLGGLEQQRPNEKTVYSIVPTDAAGVTRRRPIYIECVQDRVILQPHGIEFSPSDFVQPIQIGNPLDAAMIAVREYWNKHQLSGTEGDAYPLLVVRPSGAKSYVMARYAIQSWDDEFGYELVVEDLELDFGRRDTQLEAEIKNAIDQAKLRQQRQRAMAMTAGNSRYGRGGSTGGTGSQFTGLTVDRAKGGFTYQGPDRNGSSEESRTSGDRDGQRSSGQQAYERTASNGNKQDRSRVTRPGDTQASESANQTVSGSFGLQGGSAVGNSLDPIARTKGQDWALPSRTQGGTIYRRPISIVCSPNHITIASDANLQQRPRRIDMSHETRKALDPLIDEVWKKIDSWGIAGAGGYWRPELRIHVEPGAERRAQDLSVLLQDSGLDLKFIRK